MNNRLFSIVSQKATIAVISCVVGLSAGCVTNSSKPAADDGSSNASKPASKPESKPAAAPAVKSTAGMDSQGNVIDPTKVESGSGQQVKVEEGEGEITGKRGGNSKVAGV